MPLVQNPSIGAGGAPLLVTTTPLSQAQILSLNSSGVNVVPAPGAGKIIVMMGQAYALKFGTVAYTCDSGSDGIGPQYGQLGQGATTTNEVNLIVAATDRYGYLSGVANGSTSPLVNDANQPITLFGADYNRGPIVTATLGAGGLGYAASDTGTITTSSGDATYKVLTVGAGGAVLTFQITSPGTVYAVGNGQATATGGAQPGVGVGFTVNITAVQTGDGTLKVTTYYQILPVP